MARQPSGWGQPQPTPVTEPAPTEELLDTTVTGADGPIPGVLPPPPADQLPLIPSPSRTHGEHWWVGLHGGAGASTLARMDTPGGPDALHGWPVHEDGQEVILVAREDARGLAAAQRGIQHYVSGTIPGVHVLALVTVPSQRGKVPADLARQLRLLRGLVPLVLTMDWAPDYLWDLEPTPTRHTRTLIRTIHRITEGITA